MILSHAYYSRKTGLEPVPFSGNRLLYHMYRSVFHQLSKDPCQLRIKLTAFFFPKNLQHTFDRNAVFVAAL